MADEKDEKDTRTLRQKHLDNYRATHTHAEFLMELDCCASVVFPDEEGYEEEANSFDDKEQTVF